MSRIKRLTEALLADRGDTERADIIKCFMCRFGMMYRGSCFCSDRCRVFHDASHEHDRPHVIAYRDQAGQPMKPTVDAFRISCAHCAREFEILGLRCCSADCERRYRERQENLALMAAGGIEAAPEEAVWQPRMCKAWIPIWRTGRKVSSSTRFCSSKCARNVRTATDQVFVAATIKKPAKNKTSHEHSLLPNGGRRS
jgi:hypothetical protein